MKKFLLCFMLIFCLFTAGVMLVGCNEPVDSGDIIVPPSNSEESKPSPEQPPKNEEPEKPEAPDVKPQEPFDEWKETYNKIISILLQTEHFESEEDFKRQDFVSYIKITCIAKQNFSQESSAILFFKLCSQLDEQTANVLTNEFEDNIFILFLSKAGN